MSRRVEWWFQQAYLALIPLYPSGYLLIHGFRDNEFWKRLNRSAFPAPEHLKDLVESELDKLGAIKKTRTFVSLTDYGEPCVYGCFMTQPGAELQFPMDVSHACVEQARRLTHNIELDLGLPRYRRKIEVDSKIGSELLSRMILSDAAKMFVVQRQLQIANSGKLFSAPIFGWFAIFGAGYAIVTGLSKVVGTVLGVSIAFTFNALVYYQFYSAYNLYKTKWADEKTVDLGFDYLQGARDYFISKMRFNKMLRVVLGEDGVRNISKNGDVRRWNDQTTMFLGTKSGRRARVALLGVTVVAYPLVSLLCNGPLVNISFPWRYSVENLPERLRVIAEQEYLRFLAAEKRVPKDAVVRHHLAKSIGDYETKAAGSLGVRTGLHLATPFCLKFKDAQEALEYFSQNGVSHIDFLGVKVPVKWNTKLGEELANSFVLSENALHFIFLRDLYAHDGYASFAQRSISWVTWSSFASIFTYWLHKTATIFGGTAMSFATIYTLLISAAWFANKQWYYLYRYIADVHADNVAALSSFQHCEGGKEWYWKQLKRFRILREICPNLRTRISPSGDIKGIPTSIIVRFDQLKDLHAENNELKQVVGGDD
ncbi:hypothetical protein DICVIV_01294 [Dictyocaulus viviparus]|uniref:Uncharacterized protein n=1 Tax=Dictyocaulus viviparus TaxID=29172 RepID=A0A0D8Y8Y0_DICVI|nr:hypothetical protein DICVIV_01294 [Dictyocaulus viviparus]